MVVATFLYENSKIYIYVNSIDIYLCQLHRYISMVYSEIWLILSIISYSTGSLVPSDQYFLCLTTFTIRRIISVCKMQILYYTNISLNLCYTLIILYIYSIIFIFILQGISGERSNPNHP